MKRLFRAIWSYIFPKYEYIYFYVMKAEKLSYKENMGGYDKKLLRERTETYNYQFGARSRFLGYVVKVMKADMKRKHRRTIQATDFYTDDNTFESIFIAATDRFDNPYFQPAVLEIYAFMKKNKDFGIFSYNIDTVQFGTSADGLQKDNIYKLKIKC